MNKNRHMNAKTHFFNILLKIRRYEIKNEKEEKTTTK